MGEESDGSQHKEELEELLPLLAQGLGAPIPGQAQPNPELLRMADEGNDDALLLVAFQLQMSGNWQEAAKYAPRLLNLGAVTLAGNLASNMLSDPSMKDEGLALLDKALRSGFPGDPLAYIPQFAQRNDVDGVARLLEMARRSRPSPVSEQDWANLSKRLGQASEAFDAQLNAVIRAREEASTAIRQQEQTIEEETDRLIRLGKKVEQLSHEAASDELSKRYSTQAERNRRGAFWLTAAAVGVGAAAAGLAAFFTLQQAGKSDPDVLEGLAKAAISLPIALFATYIARLASSFRQVGWQWRHVQLQLETAEVYIAEVPEQRRQRLIETLALRFFPGQPLDPFRDSNGPHAPAGLQADASASLEEAPPQTPSAPQP